MPLLCPKCQASLEALATGDTLLACPACGEVVLPPSGTQPTGQETVTDPHPPATNEEEAPKQLGRYRVVLWLGSGSFGTVYKGRDDDLRRDVAIKVPHRHRLASAAHADAYLNEARVLARLDHPNVVPVFDVGRTPDGLCYVVSKFIEGTDLSARIRSGKLTPREALRIALAVAEALAHAHGRGLVHRDIKPANILLDRDGQPHVADFGLALGQETSDGPAFAGTPAYMSPEQARGEGHRVDVRTDLYSLGVVLYECLTGRQPFEGETLTELLEQIGTREAQPPSHLDPAIQKELDRITLKCLSKRAADRYATARALADDLAAWRDGGERPVPGAPREVPAATTPRVVHKGLRAFDAQDAEFFLQLVPGPRERNALPASIYFWKARVEAGDPGGSFPVGLMYGPSGCGKSSLVRAGLLPRLDPRVTVVYLEAAREATESRLNYALRRVCPGFAAGTEAATMIADVRRGHGISAGRKLFVVIDQLEQYLHGRREHADDGGLVAALRQADGVRVQFLLLVRDDFWLAASRLFAELELPLVEGQNVELIDLFEVPHARRVLLLFGQAHGCLPEDASRLTAEQNAFLDEAVAGLAEGGKVVSVRLSLFAEMMKARPWTPDALRAVGGPRGVGLTFLEETFSSRSANPERRAVEKEARSVLQALLPPEGDDIKGQTRSYQELLNASSLHAHPRRFDRLLTLLDRELRIISPTDSPSDDVQPGRDDGAKGPNPDSTVSERTSPGGGGPVAYQLTHDFLVPALREWLTQRKRASWRGRAELALHERSAQWARSPQSRFLPSPLEYAAVGLGVPRSRWRPEERGMMWAATRYYGGVLLAAVLAAGTLGWLLWEWNGRTQARRLVQAIEMAEPEEAALLIEQDLPRYRRWADPLLRNMAGRDDADAGQRLRASLALTPVDDGQIPYLMRRLLDCSLPEFPVVRNALYPHDERLVAPLREALRDGSRPPSQRLHAGMALALYAPDDGRWTDADAAFLVDQLLRSSRDYQDDLRDHLRPVAELLLEPLQQRFRDAAARSTARLAAADALADFARDQPELLARLAADADAEQYEVLLATLKPAESAAKVEAVAELASLARSGGGNSLTTGRQRAGAAVTLLHLGGRADAAPLFAAGDDPEALTQFVHRARERRVPPGVLLGWLADERDARTRFALLLTLGDYPVGSLSAGVAERWKARLADWYANDPSSAVHGATGWLLRRWGFGSEADRVDRTALPSDPTGRREWFVESAGGAWFTFVVFPPGEYLIGSPESERDRHRNEPRRRVRLTRPFAVADRELTRAQWDRYATARRQSIDMEDGGPGEPAVGVTWDEAVQCCRWLCEAYRLPTEAEWEIACRAGTATPYGFGGDRELLPFYGRHLETRPGPVGSLRPNLRGLFDLHGNVWEWCHDWYDPTPPDGQTDPVGPADGRYRTLRGGGWDRTAWQCRSAYRHSPTPDYRASYIGFRIAQTLPR